MCRISASTLVHVVVLDPISLGDVGESVKFRIEIFRRSPDRFSCQLWRRENYRLEPTFQSAKPAESFDVEIYVLETALAWDTIEGPNPGYVLEAVVAEIEKYFSVSIECPGLSA